MSHVTTVSGQSVDPTEIKPTGGKRMAWLLGDVKLIYHPVKRMDHSAQIRTAIALAKLRSCAHALIVSSIIGLTLVVILVVVGGFTHVPSAVHFVVVVTVQALLLSGIFLMNRIVHKEKEFKQLQWRLDAVGSGDVDLKRLLSLPFPVELKNWSLSRLESRLKELHGEGSSLRAGNEPEHEGPAAILGHIAGVGDLLKVVEEAELNAKEYEIILLAKLREMDLPARHQVVNWLTSFMIAREEVVRKAIVELLQMEDSRRGGNS